MIVLGLINARYPDGKLHEAELVLSVDSDTLFVGDRPIPAFEDFLDALVAAYHGKIGPAYSPDDFTFEMWLCESDTPRAELELLMENGLVVTRVV